MPIPTVADLLEAWTSRAPHATAGAARPFGRAVLDLLADGQEATVEAIVARTGMAPDAVREHVAAAGAAGCQVEGGAIVGAALTLRPTPHRFRVRGSELFTWCGFDALFLPILLAEPAEALSRCPVTGVAVRLSIEADGRVSNVMPDGVVVAIAGPELTACRDAGPDSELCAQMPFLASPRAGRQWLASHPGVAIVDLQQAGQIARVYAQHLGLPVDER